MVHQFFVIGAPLVKIENHGKSQISHLLVKLIENYTLKLSFHLSANLTKLIKELYPVTFLWINNEVF
jgi:hypothetical protein